MVNMLNKMWDKFLNFLENKQIYRVMNGAMIAGVCSGLSERFGVSVSLIRVLWLLASIFSFGSPILIYILFAIVMPKKPVKPNYQKTSYVDGRAWEKRQ
ncbi:PspC domain-containing protein [Gemella cuniculi]|uniref:PspC domain-containing protein n=1 Tax=Gemella cuniculi TaxID=150240 RepID=UPI000409CA28|nr:PspC domain-containing protein [Gemella cuniculi]